MSDAERPAQDCPEATGAARAADRLISRLQDKAAATLEPDSGDQQAGFADIVEELETAPEIDQVRRAVGRGPGEFGTAGRAAADPGQTQEEGPPSAQSTPPEYRTWTTGP